MIDVRALPWNITLERHSMGHPDEVGSVPFWQTELDQLIRQNPFPQFWDGLKIEVWHMNDKDLQKNKPNVLDRDEAKAGCQNSQELCFMNGIGGEKRIQIAVYPEQWREQQDGPNHITERQRNISRQSLSHGVGHLYGDECGIFSNYDRISAELTAAFRKWNTKHAQSEVEDVAEIYRAVMGGDDVRCKYSDGKQFGYHPELSTLMRGMFWLSKNLRHQVICDLVVKQDFIEWTTPGFWWLKSYYRLNLQKWQHERWTGSQWVKHA